MVRERDSNSVEVLQLRFDMDNVQFDKTVSIAECDGKERYCNDRVERRRPACSVPAVTMSGSGTRETLCLR